MNNSIRSTRPVAIWIGIGVVMLIVQVVLGGVTRLTGSGLSITEWNVVTGTIPPLNHGAWLEEFQKYRQTPQFRLLNIDFTLSDFKYIFFWEWLHRFWARLIGIVFIAGFVFLTSRRYLKQEMVKPLLILFLLGALQGAVGWIMVASGLTGDAIYVKPTRLALHFIFALGLIVYAFWFLLQLLVPREQRVIPARFRSTIWLLLILLTIQLIFGALMAGHKAATAAPTWPGINGSLWPASLAQGTPWFMNFIANKITLHFVHRNLAFIILVLILLLTYALRRLAVHGGVFDRFKNIPLALVVLQAALGILSVVVSPGIVPGRWGTFEWLAQIHQVTGMMLLLSLVLLLYLVRRRA